ncbi:protein PELOTA 1 [Cryptosporidium felis]|nr:protein PELOTA 1 [Cryptosporidium felis]
MRLLKSKNLGSGFGYVKLKIDSDEDFWDLYNLILSGDSVRSVTYRKTYREQQSGSTSVKVHRLAMTIIVKSTEYGGSSLRVSGFNAVDNEYVKMGQHHTLELKNGSELILYKRNWDWLARTRLEESCRKKVGTKDDILILLIGNGLANMFVVAPNRTTKLFGVSHNITRGGRGGHPYNESKNKFFGLITQSLASHLSLEEVDSIILGGPGFYKDDYLKFLMDSDCCKNKDFSHIFKEKKHIFLTAKASSVFQSSIDEILLSEELLERLENTKAFQQTRLIQHFQFLLATKPDYVCYGFKSTENALDNNAVETLLVSESLVRSDSLKIRARLAEITETNSKLGGKTCIFSSSHNSGKTLEGMSGIAAVLRFPVEPPQEAESEGREQERSGETRDGGEEKEFDWFQKEKDEVRMQQLSQQNEALEWQLNTGPGHEDHFLAKLRDNSEVADDLCGE